jgi:hypothetical protein
MHFRGQTALPGQHGLCKWLRFMQVSPAPKEILDEKAPHSFAAWAEMNIGRRLKRVATDV